MDDPDIDAEEDENITHMAVVTQEPPPGVARVKIPAQSMNQRIFTILLSSIAGVDAQPDTLDKGPYALRPLVLLDGTIRRGATRAIRHQQPPLLLRRREQNTHQNRVPQDTRRHGFRAACTTTAWARVFRV
eukprot:scaffold6194_cov131-Isochrysis_galbana.AAC.4